MAQDAPKSMTMSESEVQVLIQKTVNTTLTKLGIDYEDPLEMQRDFQHLREFRLSMERIKNKTMMSVIGTVIVGLMAAFWIGFRHLLTE